MKNLLISSFLLFCCLLFGSRQSFFHPQKTSRTSAALGTAGCSIPDTVKYEAEYGTFVGAYAVKTFRSNASNDTNVSSHSAVKFKMLYPANAIKICYGTGNTGTLDIKVNGVSKGTFTITSSGGYNNIREAQVSVNVNAGDTVYVGSPGVYLELDCIKAYKAPNVAPTVSITVPTAGDTLPIEGGTVTATASDADGAIAAVKFVIAGDTTLIDSTSPYTFNYVPKTFGHKSIVATAYDTCGDSTVSATRVMYVEDDNIDVVRYEAEHGTFIGTEQAPVYRNGVSNDTNVQYISYTDKGIQFIVNEDADGITLAYGTYQTGTFRLRVNGVNKGLFTIIHSNGYSNVYQSSIKTPIVTGDTVFVGSPGAGGAYIEVDYIETFNYRNIPPSVAITNPGYGDTLYLDSTYTFTATASDTDGTVDSVKFLVDGYAPHVDASSPYTFPITTDSVGFKVIKAVAYDNDGDSTVSSFGEFLVRNVIPDSLKYEAEHGTLIGGASIRPGQIGASNDTTVQGISGGTKGVEFIMKYDAHAIILGYGTGVSGSGTYTLKVNGVSAGLFSIGYTGGYNKPKESVITTNVYAGDTVFVGTPGTLYIDVDYIKAYNVNGFVSKSGPIDTFFVAENEDWDYHVGYINPSYTIRRDTLDGKYFKVINDSTLITQYSFDYERDSMYTLAADTGNGKCVKYLVKVTNVTGKFDENGFADSAVAAKYPEVNVGDYIYWNAPYVYIYDVSGIAVSYPNKILIQGKEYPYITIDLVNANGNSTSQPVVVTNFLGQVQTQEGFSMRNLDANRITGRYDSAKGYGHRYFKGWDAGYEFPHGSFGIYSNNQWKSQTSYHHFNLNTVTNRVELDYLEAGNGGFAGISWKKDGANYTFTDSSSIHHCFIHDIGSEGIYLGSTGNAPQQVFRNILIENNIILRCGGEGIQTGWLMEHNAINNNVVHSGLDWKRPFEPNQDALLQLSVVGGSTEIKNNILIGGGESAGVIELKENTTPYTITEDTVRWQNNLIYGIRGGQLVHYGFNRPDSLTNLVFDGNHYKQIGETYYEVNPNLSDTTKSAIFDLRMPNNEKIVRNCFYDYTVDDLSRVGSGAYFPDTANNVQKHIEYPHFRNYLNRADSFNYLAISRYTESTIVRYPSTDTVPAVWTVGNIVQWWNTKGETRFYECIQATSSAANQPPQNNTSTAYWQLLYWIKDNGDTSFFPPDDVRLDAGSYFDSLGMGIDTAAPSEFSIPNRLRGIENNYKGDNGTFENTEVVKEKLEAVVPSFNVYPNPASKELTIESNTPIQSVNVYDALGKLWANKQANGALATLVDVNRLQNGVYFVRILTTTGHSQVSCIQVMK